MTKQIALDFSDGIFIEVTCPKCATRATVDARSTTHPPSSCGACGVGFNIQGAVDPVRYLMQIFKQLASDTAPVKIRLISEIPN